MKNMKKLISAAMTLLRPAPAVGELLPKLWKFVSGMVLSWMACSRLQMAGLNRLAST